MKQFILSLLAIGLLSSCGGTGTSRYNDTPGDTLTSRSDLLTLIDRGECVTAEIADPWNEGKTLASYALVDRNADIPEGLDDEYVIIRVPLQHSLVYSSTNTAAIGELGSLPAVAAVADGNYYAPSDTIARLIAQGSIKDIGNSMSPSPEAIIDVAPDAILVSPYENAGHGVIDELGIPVIDCADYMETTPLGRAEWLLLLGELYGNRQLARDIYNAVSTDYESLRKTATDASSRPKVITEMLTSGVWYVPGGNSYMARMLQDAGAAYPWADNSATGSLQLDIAAVIDRASDADIWLMRNYGAEPTLASLRDVSPLNAGFKAFVDGEVYNCNTAERPIFNDIAFHPERVLLDFIIIFHPELMDGIDTYYYKKIKAE